MAGPLNHYAEISERALSVLPGPVNWVFVSQETGAACDDALNETVPDPNANVSADELKLKKGDTVVKAKREP
jgi:hypothetical protein